ncbi:MAG: ABC transporter substrate-binding protein [Spirochaetota bacterium]
MKKSIILLILIITFVAGASGYCSAVKKLQRKPIQLILWHSMSIYQGDTLEEMVKQYNATHDQVQVQPVFQGLYDELKVKLVNAAKTDNMPDIAQVAIEYLDVFIAEDELEPITYLVPEEAKKDILSQFWNGVSRNGEIYAFPFNQSVQVLYYNKNAFRKAGLDPQKPPRTWDQVIKYGKKLTRDIDGDGQIDQWGTMVSLEGVFGFTPLIRQVGGEFLNEENTQALFNSEEGLKVMNLVQDMSYKYKIMPTNWTLFEGTSAFLEGKIAMGPITCAGIKYAEENLPWELGIGFLPYIENKSVLLGGAGLAIFTKVNAKKKAAMSFFNWITSKNNSIRWHKQTGYLPLRQSAIDSLELKSFHQQNPNYRVPIEELPYSRPPDFTPYLPQIDKIIRFAIEDIMINRNDPQKALALAAKKVNQLLQKEENK